MSGVPQRATQVAGTGEQEEEGLYVAQWGGGVPALHPIVRAVA